MNKSATQAEYDRRYPDVPIERWRNNVLDAIGSIADRDHQAANWFREDTPVWENPDEVICVLFDDSQFELFLIDCDFSLRDQQREAGRSLLSKLNQFFGDTPKSLDPLETINDPRWEEIQFAARHFVAMFSA
jgi:hypothetical protein